MSAVSNSHSNTQPLDHALDGKRFVGVVLERGESALMPGHADVQERALPFVGVRCLRVWGRCLHRHALRRDDRFRVRDRERAVRQAAAQERVRGPRLDGTLTMVRDGQVAGEKLVLAGKRARCFAPLRPGANDGNDRLSRRHARSCRTASTRGAWPTGSTSGSVARLHATTTRRSSRAARCSSWPPPTPKGRPDCSYKGGAAGFVRIVGADESSSRATTATAVPQPRQPARQSGGRAAVHRLRIAAPAACQRQGDVLDDAEALARHHGAQLVVRVRAERIFPNCPRYIHRSGAAELSPDVPRPGHDAAGRGVEVDEPSSPMCCRGQRRRGPTR